MWIDGSLGHLQVVTTDFLGAVGGMGGPGQYRHPYRGGVSSGLLGGGVRVSTQEHV